MLVEGKREAFERWTLEIHAGHWKLNGQLACNEQMHLPLVLQPICCFYFYLSHAAGSNSQRFSCASFCDAQTSRTLRDFCVCILFPPSLSPTHLVKINWDNSIHERSEVLSSNGSLSKPLMLLECIQLSKMVHGVSIKRKHWSLATMGGMLCVVSTLFRCEVVLWNSFSVNDGFWRKASFEGWNL